MNIERGNVRNQFLMSSVLVSLYAVTKVLGQMWGPIFCPSPARPGGTGGPSSDSVCHVTPSGCSHRGWLTVPPKLS